MNTQEKDLLIKDLVEKGKLLIPEKLFPKWEKMIEELEIDQLFNILTRLEISIKKVPHKKEELPEIEQVNMQFLQDCLDILE
ncbi:MAG: hypothetical protein KJI71_03960 [Patescibacteria group bacterium]|nr:hypothetical protein [Patescibacteria group bacterium]